ncbi:hypothetical protein THAOC_13392 [Thalassiosira oceanica]|uniref:SPRY domain-containing protein n=1 Tax=Thalassiosira oceanica TaxID=159749 RepID=K0SL93_THAOC|nr:hypothetical protein THAOC_13392 [Thalassiosira oceanica]|eukprot:EJK65724.1 hypothetical protein THAOC_13392 [Thalassiosira oceanica]
MSAPSLSFTADDQAKGCGLALIDCPVEQDRAYWEWHIDETASQQGSLIMFGVSNKRNQKFYEILGESSIPAEKHGTKFLAGVEGLKEGDVVGVAVQQSQVPMIRIFVNGEESSASVSKFRGSCFPAVYLPDAGVTFLYREDQLRSRPAGWDPLIAERSLV